MERSIGSLAMGLCSLAVMIVACGNTEKDNGLAGGGAAGSKPGAGGKPSANGMGGSAGYELTGGSAGSGVTVGGVSGAQAMAGSASGGVDSGGAGSSPSAGESSGGVAGGSGGNGGAGLPDPTEVKRSTGCGTLPTQATGELVPHTIPTSGTKDANCAARLGGVPKCGPWSLEREYHLWLPPGYDETKPYPIVFQGPGCGGTGADIYPLSPTNMLADAGVAGSVIRVGLTPPPNSIGHGTNENQGCFDDKEGDDSVDFVFYEKLVDRLKAELCIDENRVFVSGNSSGAWLANELACKYAGDAHGHAVRGVAVNMGGLPSEPQFVPTCSTKPLAGIWVWEFNDGGQPFNPSTRAVQRALQVNGCGSTSWETALLEDFPIGGGNPDKACKRVVDCPAHYPVVVCAMSGTGQGSHDAIVNPAFARFIDTLAAP